MGGKVDPISNNRILWIYEGRPIRINGVLNRASARIRVKARIHAEEFDAGSALIDGAGARHASNVPRTIQAAYSVLVRLYPAQSASLDQQRTASLMAISRGWHADQDDSIEQGIEWGQTVADAICACAPMTGYYRDERRAAWTDA